MDRHLQAWVMMTAMVDAYFIHLRLVELHGVHYGCDVAPLYGRVLKVSCGGQRAPHINLVQAHVCHCLQALLLLGVDGGDRLGGHRLLCSRSQQDPNLFTIMRLVKLCFPAEP